MHACLAHRALHEAKVQAFKRKLVQMKFCGGLVLDGDDDTLRHRRSGRPFDRHETGASYPDRISGAFLYGGPVHGHFGHFMAEMVHRIVPSKLLYGAAPFIFVTEAGSRAVTSFETLPLFAREVLELLGIGPAEFRLVAENAVVEQLSVVEQGSELGLGPKPGYLDDLHEYVTPRLDALHRSEVRPKKVYVSRSQLPGGLFLGERYLEEQLAAEGFTSISPETLPVSVQMDIYRKTDVVVFPEGSACHGVELLGTGALKQCFLICRRDSHSRSFERVLQPRASVFASSAGHPFIGTKYRVGGSRNPSRTLGVHAFDARELVAFLRGNDIARLPTFSEADYHAAAQLDLHRYLKGSAITGSKLLRRIMRLVVPNWSMRRTIPGARRELDEAFRRYLETARMAEDANGEGCHQERTGKPA